MQRLRDLLEEILADNLPIFGQLNSAGPLTGPPGLLTLAACRQGKKWGVEREVQHRPHEPEQAQDMAGKIRIQFEGFSVVAELLETPTTRAIRAKLPFSSEVNRWGEEIYFSIPVSAALEPEAREVVEKGDVAYWPPGQALAIFFGATPASTGEECRAASPVNVFGRIAGDLSRLSGVPEGSPVHVEMVAH